jgi:hypothetical protein
VYSPMLNTSGQHASVHPLGDLLGSVIDCTAMLVAQATAPTLTNAYRGNHV